MPLHTLTENKTYGLSLAIAQLTSFKKETHDHQNALCICLHTESLAMSCRVGKHVTCRMQSLVSASAGWF